MSATVHPTAADCTGSAGTLAPEDAQVHYDTHIPNRDQVPESLLSRRQWIAWWGLRGTDGRVRLPNGEITAKPLKAQRKPHKLPIDPFTGGLAQTDRAATWGTYDEAVHAASQFGLTGIGFVFSENDPFSGIDLDDCRDPNTGEIDAWATEIINQLRSYSEVSPSRTGVKIWVCGRLPKGKGNQTKCGRGKVEMFSWGRYFTFTGEPLEGDPKQIQIEGRQEELSALHSRLFSQRNASSAKDSAPRAQILLSDSELLARARGARNGAKFQSLWDGVWKQDYASQSEADMALCCQLAYWTGCDAARMDSMFRQSALMRDKWEREDYRERTLMEACQFTTNVFIACQQPTNCEVTADRPKGMRNENAESKETEMEAKLATTILTFNKWLHLPDIGPVEVVLGSIAANLMQGDPLWLLLTGPPGGGKTELLSPLSSLSNAHMAATLTEASLLSGTAARDRAKDAKGGLLQQIGAFGFIVCKDFTSILSMHRDSRSSVLAALREIYDGSWTRHVGVDGGRTLHWSGKVALIAGCTPTIDRHHSVMAAMGERFVMYRLPPLDEDQQARTALKHEGREGEMRRQLAVAVCSLFNDTGSFVQTTLDEQEQGRLIALASLAARCRSSVERDGRNREIDLIPEHEAPARLTLTLSRLLGGMSAIGVERHEAWRVVIKAALDCMPAVRRRAVDLLGAQDDPISTSQIAAAISYPAQTTRRALEDLAAHNVVRRRAQGNGMSDQWELSDLSRAKCQKAGLTFPEMSLPKQ